MAKDMKLGEGGRFKKIEAAGKKEGYSEKGAAGLAAKIGREKYGASKMAEMAAKGRKK